MPSISLKYVEVNSVVWSSSLLLQSSVTANIMLVKTGFYHMKDKPLLTCFHLRDAYNCLSRIRETLTLSTCADNSIVSKN